MTRRLTTHCRKQVFPILEKFTKDRYEEKLSCIGPEVDDPYVLHIPGNACNIGNSGNTGNAGNIGKAR